MFKKLITVLVLSILFFPGFISESFSQEIPTPVTAKLISDTSKFNPGELIKLGILFDIDPGWHIYWKYPGETGLPTKVKFHAPDDLKVGGINWPLPKAFEKPAGGFDYGYEDSVLLWTDIQIPPDFSEGESVEYSAEASWISCKEICIPGKAALKYEVKTEGPELHQNEEIFEIWQKLLPIKVSEQQSPFEINVKTIRKDVHALKIELGIVSIGEYKKVEFYPDPGDSRRIANLETVKSEEDNTTNINFDLVTKTEHEISDKEMTGLLVYLNESGKRSAIEIEINLTDN